MKDSIYAELSSILNDSFKSILFMLQVNTPHATMEIRCHSNDAFLFRFYAQYSASERVIVASFDIQAVEKQFHIWGDIAQENGLILKDVLDEIYRESSDVDHQLVDCAKKFTIECRKELQLIENALTRMNGAGH